ncbi:RNA polymerase subunit sigma-70 [Miltoncostaea oceani]|uniref:RNA polymerase subunit sigma-70 n=1 Tax=Miltoncostaea oceani TaxID=2843216 RepID=UPI001C3CEE53|nr:RNA polymerase subunit sigma-70 [Miltoncostaea oceani]
MSTSRTVDDGTVAAAVGGDEAAFGRLVERHRGELQVHCYRMLGSLEDAEDAVQETFLRAWRRRETYAGRATFRAWLYGIATNASLDAVASRKRRMPEGEGAASPAEVPWLQPCPDRLLAAAAPPEDEPEAVVVTKETIELAFLIAIQYLPPAQRAVLILRDVLGWSAKEAAEPLEASVAAVNSSLQRARATLQERLPEYAPDRPPTVEPSAEEREMLRRFMEATERNDIGTLATMMTDDARFSMPEVVDGREAIVECWREGGFGTEQIGELRCMAVWANMQPAVACYSRRHGDTRFRPMALDVLRVEGGMVAEINTFAPDVFPAFGLPAEL